VKFLLPLLLLLTVLLSMLWLPSSLLESLLLLASLLWLAFLLLPTSFLLQVLSSLLLLTSPDVPVVSCAAVSPVGADILIAVDIPRVLLWLELLLLLPPLLLFTSFLLQVFTNFWRPIYFWHPCCCWPPLLLVSRMLLSYLLLLIFLLLVAIWLQLCYPCCCCPPCSCCSTKNKNAARLSDYDYRTGNFVCYWIIRLSIIKSQPWENYRTIDRRTKEYHYRTIGVSEPEFCFFPCLALRITYRTVYDLLHDIDKNHYCECLRGEYLP
jgi:hypothetical protein